MMHQLERLRVDSELIDVIWKLKHISVGLLDTSVVNAAIPLISLYIYASSSLRKYVAFIMTIILMISYGAEKNIGSPNYLKM